MKVKVALDETEGSFTTLKWALDHLFNRPIENSQEEPPHLITLVHVRQPLKSFAYPPGSVVYATQMIVDALRKDQEEITARIFSRALQMYKEKMAISLNPEAAVEVTADNGKEGLEKNLLSCFFKIHAPKEPDDQRRANSSLAKHCA